LLFSHVKKFDLIGLMRQCAKSMCSISSGNIVTTILVFIMRLLECSACISCTANVLDADYYYYDYDDYHLN